MSDCTLDSTPLTASATGLVLYYDDSDGHCYTQASGGTYVPSVLVNTPANTVVIQFQPCTGSVACPENRTGYCGTGNTGSYTKAGVIGAPASYFTLSFATSSAAQWGWDFADPSAPPPIKIKVRVRRI